MADDCMTVAPFSTELAPGIHIRAYSVHYSEEPFRIAFTDGQNRYEVRFNVAGEHVGTSIYFGMKNVGRSNG